MSDESTVPPAAPRRKPELPRLCAAYGATLAEELARVLNAALPLETLALEIVPAAGVHGRDALVAQAGFRVLDDPGGTLRFVLPMADAATLAALLRGASKEEIAAERERSLGGELLDAFGQIVQRAADVLAGLLAESVGCSGLEREGDGAAPANLPEPDAFVRARFVFPVEGFPNGRIDLLWPEELAARWFGYGPRVPLGERPLVLLDPNEAERRQAAALAGALERVVDAPDPESLAGDLVGALAGAGAVVVAWDLGGRAGLELAEALARDPRTERIPVLLAAPAATRAMLEAALRAGARGFVLTPYDAGEIRRRLG